MLGRRSSARRQDEKLFISRGPAPCRNVDNDPGPGRTHAEQRHEKAPGIAGGFFVH